MIAKAKMMYLRSSAQKTRLVVDLIRGRGVNDALTVLSESPKTVAKDVLKVLRSAVANAQKEDQRVDADTLIVSRVYVDGGPTMKRIRPATFGRAFRILRRTCHISMELEAKPDAGPRVSRAKRRAATRRDPAAKKGTGARGAERASAKAPPAGEAGA